jgi:hypothetical protein
MKDKYLFTFDMPICSADEEELLFAVAKAKAKAKEVGMLIYVYEKNLFFMMSNIYPEAHVIAKAYPGGRTELKGFHK